MPSAREQFWNCTNYVVIGNTGKMPFPVLTFRGLKMNRKTAYAVDPVAMQIDNDMAYKDLRTLPGPVEAAVIEVPPEETAPLIHQAAELGIKKIWLNDGSECDEAILQAKKDGVELYTGRCAVMYLDTKFPHSVHKWIVKLQGTY